MDKAESYCVWDKSSFNVGIINYLEITLYLLLNKL